MAKLKFTLCKVIEIGATGDQTCHDSSRQSVPHGRPLNQCCYRQERLLQDIMTPLCALLSSYSQDWGPADSSHPPKTEKQKVFEMVLWMLPLQIKVKRVHFRNHSF